MEYLQIKLTKFVVFLFSSKTHKLHAIILNFNRANIFHPDRSSMMEMGKR